MRALSRAYTLMEVMLSLVIVAALAFFATNAYTSFLDRSRINRAITDIYLIETLITRFEVQEGGLPDTLAETEADGMRDPWDRPYQYTNLADAPKNGAGKPMVGHRKDRNLNPINTDYDLYSSGKDGASRMPLTARQSHDDIVRAGNGAFVGLAENY